MSGATTFQYDAAANGVFDHIRQNCEAVYDNTAILPGEGFHHLLVFSLLSTLLYIFNYNHIYDTVPELLKERHTACARALNIADMTAMRNMCNRPVTRSSSKRTHGGDDGALLKRPNCKYTRTIKHATSIRKVDRLKYSQNSCATAQAKLDKDVMVISSDEDDGDNPKTCRQRHVAGKALETASTVVATGELSAEQESQDCAECRGASEQAQGLRRDVQSTTAIVQRLQQFVAHNLGETRSEMQNNEEKHRILQVKLAEEQGRCRIVRQELSALQILHDQMLAEQISLRTHDDEPRVKASHTTTECVTKGTSQFQQDQRGSVEVKGRGSQITSESELTTSQFAKSPKLPSSTRAEQDRRNDNLKKRYIKVKSEFDELFTAVHRVCAVSKVMEIDEFGEIGKRLKELRRKASRGGKGVQRG